MNRFIHYSSVVYLSLIVLIRMMAMPISLAEYNLNKNYIAENICENRMRTDIHCGGTCYLSKQLAKANDNQDAQNHKGSVKTLMIDFFEPVTKPSFGCSRLAPQRIRARNTCSLNCLYTNPLFRPPIV